MKNRSRAGGFTLVELLVVIAIIAILAAIVVPNVLTFLGKGKNVKCINNLRQLGLALVTYSTEYESYPDSSNDGPDMGQQLINDLRMLMPPAPGRAILQGQDVLFVCPLKGVPPSPTAITYLGPNYALNDAVESTRPLMRDADADHGGIELNVLYKGTNVQTIKINTKEHGEAKTWCP